MMLDIVSLQDFVQKKPAIALAVTLGLIAMLGLSVFLVNNFISQKQKHPTVAVISFGDGQNEVVVNRNGDVTINTPFGTYTQHWDPEKVRKFFENYDKLDFDNLAEYLGTEAVVKLTLSNGKTVKIEDSNLEELVSEAQKALEDIYSQNEQKPATPDLSQYNKKPDLSPSPTPSGGGSQNGGGNNNGSGGGGGNNNNPWQRGNDPQNPTAFSCEQTDTKTGRKIIISNTVCAK
jgi:hypothetical protein